MNYPLEGDDIYGDNYKIILAVISRSSKRGVSGEDKKYSDLARPHHRSNFIGFVIASLTIY